MSDARDRAMAKRERLRLAREGEREQPQDFSEAFADFGREFGKALGNLAFVTSAQGAMGWMLQSEPTNAREALRNMTDAQAADIADAAEQLAALIREERA